MQAQNARGESIALPASRGASRARRTAPRSPPAPRARRPWSTRPSARAIGTARSRAPARAASGSTLARYAGSATAARPEALARPEPPGDGGGTGSGEGSAGLAAPGTSRRKPRPLGSSGRSQVTRGTVVRRISGILMSTCRVSEQVVAVAVAPAAAEAPAGSRRFGSSPRMEPPSSPCRRRRAGHCARAAR
jgi:hypothetical protein